MATKAELEAAIEAIFDAQETSDGTRPGMIDTLDEIRDLCVSVCPDLDTEADTDDDGIADDDELQSNDLEDDEDGEGV